MAPKLSWTIKVPTPDQKTLDTSRSVDVEAYDQTNVSVPGNDPGTTTNPTPTVTANIQPSSQLTDIHFVFISSDRYGPELTYSVSGTGGATDVILDGPQLFAGAGMVNRLGAAPQTIVFKNEMGAGKDASVMILVGRTAI